MYEFPASHFKVHVAIAPGSAGKCRGAKAFGDVVIALRGMRFCSWRCLFSLVEGTIL
jgi:hypothetical protein